MMKIVPSRKGASKPRRMAGIRMFVFLRPILFIGFLVWMRIGRSNCRCFYLSLSRMEFALATNANIFSGHISLLQPTIYDDDLVVGHSSRIFQSRAHTRYRRPQNKFPSSDPLKWFRSFVFVLYSLLAIIYQFHAVITWLIVIVNVTLARLSHSKLYPLCGNQLNARKRSIPLSRSRFTRFIGRARDAVGLWKSARTFLLYGKVYKYTHSFPILFHSIEPN